ncbi:S8 family serine peptidase [uncultured Kordia sp.]|uniref:S8 family serine peptidase n=1 Tax=uncultured Kordia sp. TaxID=507699 RepID=UPI00260D3AA1|nr:S8 family serine peptidase [uncultured Kordia sp.]
MKPIQLFVILSSFLIIACTSSKLIVQKPYIITSSFAKKQALTQQEKQTWYYKDIIKDSIAGISLNKAYQELEKLQASPDTVIVAVLDMRIHKNHEDIKQFIWENPNEVPNNGLDDDKNGYIDDINGWNFLGNSKGDQVYRANFEYVRIMRKFDKKFKNKRIDEVKDTINFKLYLKAKQEYSEELGYVKRRIKLLNYKKRRKIFLDKQLGKKYLNTKLTIEVLQNLKPTSSIVEKNIQTLIRLKKDSIKNVADLELRKRYLDIYLNLDFEEREIIGDDVNDINDTLYGNNKISADNTDGAHTHAVKVAGLIAANRDNNKGIRGVTNLVKIMPIAISPYGDEQDKDIALAIRYAVDNGAKIINISSSKYFSLHQDWVMKALQYAEKRDVLVVTSAGNVGYNLDEMQNYPDDTDKGNTEILKNFIKVGASTYQLDENLVHYTSNYGRESVDIFAPGKNVYTTYPNNTYGFSSGTSYSAPIVSGIAALIRSYYSGLSASDVKNIILNSGVAINWNVNKPPNIDNKELVPFSSLSKSGKIANAYNALLLAEEVSKKKQKRKK